MRKLELMAQSIADRMLHSFMTALFPGLIHPSELSKVRLLKFLVVFVQMEDVHQRGDGRPAMGALEGKLAAGQRRHQADAFISAQGVVEFNGTMARQGGQHLQHSEWQSPLDSSC